MKLTEKSFLPDGVPQGLNPPEKLGKLRQTIDLMLHIRQYVQYFNINQITKSSKSTWTQF